VLRAERKQEMQERIFRTALALFRAEGYERVTVDRIAAACGIAKGTFFNYFRKKEHILLYLGQSQVGRLEELAGELQPGTDLRGALLALFRGLLERYRQGGELMQLALLETMRSAGFAEEEAPNVRKLQEVVERLIRKAEADRKGSSERAVDGSAVERASSGSADSGAGVGGRDAEGEGADGGVYGISADLRDGSDAGSEGAGGNLSAGRDSEDKGGVGAGHYRGVVKAWDAGLVAEVLTGLYFQTLLAWTLMRDPDADLTGMFERRFDVVWYGIADGEKRAGGEGGV